jgi:hypothetical protein
LDVGRQLCIQYETARSQSLENSVTWIVRAFHLQDYVPEVIAYQTLNLILYK